MECLHSSRFITLHKLNKTFVVFRPIVCRMEVNYKSSQETDETRGNISHHFTCRSCGMKFDDIAEMQQHITIEHHQKGDIP